MIEQSGRRFISDKVTEAIIERIVAQVGRRIDKSQPLVDARLPDGSRVNAIIPPLAVKGPCLTVRKFPAQRLTMDDLVEMGSITTAAATFLRACVIDRRNILVSGGTGTGKTTMLNVLSSFIPFKERIVTIEDTTELRLHQEHVVTLETKPPNVEGAGEYTIRDLVKNALRMRPDRVIVGECRGAEALDMIQAMNTGHDGSMTTVHANSAREVIERLEVLVLMAADLPVTSIHRQMASALDLIVHISRLPGGARVVTQISEVVRYDPGGEADRRHRHLQLPQRRVAAADRLPAVVHRFAGGEGACWTWSSSTAAEPAQARTAAASHRTKPWQMMAAASLADWLGGGGGRGGLRRPATGSPLALDAVERDLADKLRRLRASTRNLRKYLVLWLIGHRLRVLSASGSVLDSLVFAVLIAGCSCCRAPGICCGAWPSGAGRRSRTSWPTPW